MPDRPTVLVNHLYERANRISGISQYLFSLLAALLRRDDFSYVLATNWDEAELPRELRDRGLRVERLKLSDSTPVNLARQTVALRRLMSRHKAAVEFCPNPVSGLFKSWPSVFTVHDLYFDVAPEQYRGRHLLWWKLFFPMTARAASRIICVSEQTRCDLVRFHPNCAAKTVVVHEAPTLAPRGVPDVSRQPRGLFVANVSPNKGGDILIAALDALARRGSALEVCHVGQDNGAFAAAQSALKTEAGPHLLGTVSADRLAELYASSLFLAFPSTYEGFGLPVLEAQAFGLPVIATDIPVLREVAGEGALFFPAGDSEALADRMTALAQDPVLWRRMHEAALRNVSGFSWERAAEQTSTTFRDAIAIDTRR